MNIFYYLGENHIALGITSFLFWCLLYFTFSKLVNDWHLTKHFSKCTQVSISMSFVSIVQGFLCGGIGALGIIKCRHDVMKALYDPIWHYCTFGTGYFMYDLIAMYYANWLELYDKGKLGSFSYNMKSYMHNNALMIAHHIILTSILFPALIVYSSMGHFFAGCFFCMELSSPFVNFRIILSKLGLKETKLYLYNGITMMVLFAVFRVLIFVYMYAWYLIQQSIQLGLPLYNTFLRIPLLCHLYSGLVLSPQVYWLSMMINGVFSVLANRPKALDKYD